MSEKTTTDGLPPRPGFENESAPAPINPATGQHEAYWVLPEAERAKGFVRPLRTSYRHVGRPGPKHPLRDLTDEQKAQHSELGYVKYEEYPESESPIAGRFWTQAALDLIDRGCGAVTTMSVTLAETYARQPNYYGSTFCVRCRAHLPVGVDGEFVWEGTKERVGT